MSWIAVAVGGSALVGAGASIVGANKNADAIEKGSDQAAAVQGRALDASLAINRPTQQLGNSAQRQLAALFGLPDPGGIDFDRVDSSASGAADVGIPGLSSGQQATSEDLRKIYQSVLGREPDAEGFRFYANSGLTAQQIVEATRGSAEYQDKLVAGTLPDSETSTGQEFVGGSQTNPAFGGNLNELVNNNPLIKFNIEQGERQISRNAAARGLQGSGRTLEDLTTFNNDQNAANGTGMVLNSLFQLAGFGQQGNAASQNALTQTANNQSNLALGAADARGSAFQNAGNAIGNAANDIGGAFSLRSILNSQKGG